MTSRPRGDSENESWGSNPGAKYDSAWLLFETKIVGSNLTLVNEVKRPVCLEMRSEGLYLT